MTEQNEQQLTVQATLVVNPVDMRQGTLTVFKKGLSFQRTLATGFLDIPWESVDYISVQLVFGFYWRGIFVRTSSGDTINFLTAKTKRLTRVARLYLKPQQIRYRKSLSARAK